MKLSEIVSVTGLPGLYKASGKRTDGLIVTSLVDGSTKFVSGRVHLFSTLDNITIYTEEGSIELKAALARMKESESKNPANVLKTDDQLKAYFAAVLPEYDKEKVYASHMKKLVSWYNILNGKGLIEELVADDSSTEATGTEEAKAESGEQAEAKPESKATKATKADKGDAAKPKKETKPRAEKAIKANTKPAAGGRKTVTPRKAS